MPEWDTPNPATTPGSAPYYVVRFAHEAERERLTGIFAWFEHLAQILARVSDPGVTRLKLDWWRDEIGRLGTGNEHHPLTQDLARHLTNEIDRDALLRSLDATEERILCPQPADEDELENQCRESGGALSRLLAPQASNGELLERMGSAIEMVARVQNLTHEAHQGRQVLPRSSLHRHRVDWHALEANAECAELGTLLDDLLQPYRASLREGLQAPRDARLTNLLRLAAQSERLLRHLRRRHYQVQRERIDLTPLGRLWAAWRIR